MELSFLMKETLAIILGGGQGRRLYPLTKHRSKPAVPIGGKYRLIDIPISNCINSDINKIFILTQYNSASLNKHINHTYRFDNFHKGFVDILAAEQSGDSKDWYQGTADAVRQNLKHFTAYRDVKYILILSGDQIYSMNYRELLDTHKENNADVSIPITACNREDARSLGIVKVNGKRIGEFIEKPKKPETLNKLKSNTSEDNCNKDFFASMGIYLFNIEVLLELLDRPYTDFGKELIPFAIKYKKVIAHHFTGYWKDLGTISNFHEANIDFVSKNPAFDFYKNTIFTNSRYLAATKINDAVISNSMISDGSLIDEAKIKRTLVGLRSVIKKNTSIYNSILIGADYYETDDEIIKNQDRKIPDIGIGENTVVENAIIDKNARIGDNCRLVNTKKYDFFDSPDETYYIRDSIIIIPKNSIIKNNTVI